MNAAVDVDGAVAAAIACLYRTFVRRPPAPIEGCECCVDPADSAQLSRLAREDVPAELAARYARKAITTWGGEADLRWYLPRLAELVARDDGVGIDILVDKVSAAGWAQWPADERAAVAGYLDALWARALRADGIETVPELIVARQRLGLELAPWLDAIAGAGLGVIAGLVDIAVNARSALATVLRPRVVTAATLDRLTTGYVATGDDRLASAADLLICEPALPP
jgi:hypothetical protein